MFSGTAADALDDLEMPAVETVEVSKSKHGMHEPSRTRVALPPFVEMSHNAIHAADHSARPGFTEEPVMLAAPYPVRFPAGFRWGSAMSAHQVEGDNRANDWWRLLAPG